MCSLKQLDIDGNYKEGVSKFYFITNTRFINKPQNHI